MDKESKDFKEFLEYPEPQGYSNTPSFVKSNYLNNDSYLQKCSEVYPTRWVDAIFEAHRKIKELDPEYNIAQIKEKFWGLRYYVDLTSNSDGSFNSELWDKVNKIVSEAEYKAGDYKKALEIDNLEDI